MVTSKVRLVTGLLLCLVGSPLAADWQFTRWGMSEIELIVAAPNITLLADNSSFRSNLKIGSMEFKSRYVFDVVGSSTSLSSVRLSPNRKSDCPEIVQLLRQKYGSIYTTKGVSGYTGAIITTWRDEPSGNKVEFVQTTICEIVYSPLDKDPKEGL